MKITKKELFKFCDENNDAINELQSQSDSTDFLLSVLIQQLKDSGVIDEISPEPKPQLKQLDQSIFDGLDEKWRFAAVDQNAETNLFEEKPAISSCGNYWVNASGAFKRSVLHLDNSSWQNSLIERDTSKELLEVDLSSELTGSELCKAMLARGDKYVVCFMSYSNDATAEFHENARIVVAHDDKGFYVHDEYYQHAIPINNQGEPLTASEVGL